MGEAREVRQHPIMVGKQGQEDKEAKLHGKTEAIGQPPPSSRKSYGWWLRIATYSVFLLAGQSAATLLGRLYFEKGGNGKWMATLVRVVGVPIILPFYFLTQSEGSGTSNSSNIDLKFVSVLTFVYVILGIFQAAVCMFHSLGLLYLPVTTYSLICASQLGFNALFSFFLNSQKFTPFIINSIVLLTVSSILLVFQNGSLGSSDQVPKHKYTVGFICTVAGSAGYGLFLSLTQLAFRKVVKQQNLKVVLDMILYPTIVATLAVLVGLFAGGEWKGLGREMDEFKLGKVSYIMTLFWTAICWQVFSIGAMGLILEVTSLFCNVISSFGLPLLPILAVFFFRDKINGITIIAIMLAIWGSLSYIYQQHLDQEASKKDEIAETRKEASEVSLSKGDEDVV